MLDYDTLRHIADSWGLVYMVGIFGAVTVFIFLPGAKTRAKQAALIPLMDGEELERDRDGH